MAIAPTDNGVPVIRCTRCGSEIYLDGVEWPDPEDLGHHDVWVYCHAEASGGGDPMGEFNDGEGCEQVNIVYRDALPDGTWGPVTHDAERRPRHRSPRWGIEVVRRWILWRRESRRWGRLFALLFRLETR